MSEILFGPVPHEEAAQFIADKPAVSREVFNQMLPEVRARTFLVSGLVPLDVAQKLRDRIADLPRGADWNEVKQELANNLSPFLRDDKGEPDDGQAQRKAELLLRTHGYQAYAASQYNVMERQKDVFPYWRYQTAQDDRVRDSHAALEGVVLPANDAFWQTHFPPWDFNCRCTVVPLSDADVAEIKQEDQGKPAEQRSVLSPETIARMNDSGTLVRGPNVNVDVRSPRQKREGDGYAWQPGDLRIPLATLKERYSPEVWGAFEKFARGTAIGGAPVAGNYGYGRTTVWTWLEQGPAARVAPAVVPPPPAAVPPSPVPPVPAPPAVAAVPVTRQAPQKAPVSSALEVTTRTAVTPHIHAAISNIDRVHDDGALPRIRIGGRPKRGAWGHFMRAPNNGGSIEIGAKGPWPRLTTVHEVGHFLDWSALGAPGAMASEAHPEMAAWRAAVEASQAIKGIRAGALDFNSEYFLRNREMWARSYAQYIAHKSGDATMLAELDKIRTAPKIGHLIQWSDEDFKPIAAAIDELFKQKGWIA